MIDYKSVLATQLDETITALNLSDYNVVIDSEVAFYTHEQTLDHNTIYCVIKELSGANIYDTYAVPTELHIFTEQNSVEVAKQIFDYYCKNYNLSIFTSGFYTIQTFLDTPEIEADFYNAGEGFRATMEVDATFLIYQDVLDVASAVIDGTQEQIVKVSFSYSGANDTKAFANERLQRSVISNGTRALTILTPSKFTALTQKALAVYNGELNVNSDFAITINFRNGFVLTGTFKLDNVNFDKSYGELPVMEFSFIK